MRKIRNEVPIGQNHLPIPPLLARVSISLGLLTGSQRHFCLRSGFFFDQMLDLAFLTRILLFCSHEQTPNTVSRDSEVTGARGGEVQCTDADIRVGPNQGGKKIRVQYRGFIDQNTKTPGVYRPKFSQCRGFIGQNTQTPGGSSKINP